MNVPDKDSIERTLNNDATKDEAREVIKWFQTMEGQAWLSARLDDDEKIVIENEEMLIDHKIPSEVIYNKIKKQLLKQKVRRIFWGAAAVLIPFIILLLSFFYVNSRVDLLAGSEYDEVYVPKGEKMQLIFQDGSKVHLNSESRIRYPRKFAFSERKVELEGEGWFDISKNKKRPFIVDLGCVRVRVLGTTFVVKAYPKENDISVELENGSIELITKMSKYFNMIPGDKAVYERSSGNCKITRPENHISYSEWKQHTFVFNNSPLSEVMTTLSRTYNINFIVEDSLALNYNYTLTTNSKNLSFVLKELEKITPVRFVENDTNIRVRIKKD